MTTYLSDRDWRPLAGLLTERLQSLEASTEIVFLMRAAAMAPGIYHMSKLLDQMQGKTTLTTILFDIAKEQDTRRVTQRIAEFIYTCLLRELDYAEDFDIAELEIELEAEGKLEQFIARCRQIHGQEWRIVRKGAQRLSRASAVLHALNSVTYPAADSWAHTQRSRDAAISVSKVVLRTFELFGRRRPGKALVLVIDAVGQHVARSGDKIEDLRATIEEFGKVGRNLVKARKIPAPCWIVVTSQEKLDEVVAAIDSKRVELAKLQDRKMVEKYDQLRAQSKITPDEATCLQD